MNSISQILPSVRNKLITILRPASGPPAGSPSGISSGSDSYEPGMLYKALDKVGHFMGSAGMGGGALIGAGSLAAVSALTSVLTIPTAIVVGGIAGALLFSGASSAVKAQQDPDSDVAKSLRRHGEPDTPASAAGKSLMGAMCATGIFVGATLGGPVGAIGGLLLGVVPGLGLAWYTGTEERKMEEATMKKMIP